jgi:hypothetical protein
MWPHDERFEVLDHKTGDLIRFFQSLGTASVCALTEAALRMHCVKIVDHAAHVGFE